MLRADDDSTVGAWDTGLGRSWVSSRNPHTPEHEKCSQGQSQANRKQNERYSVCHDSPFLKTGNSGSVPEFGSARTDPSGGRSDAQRNQAREGRVCVKLLYLLTIALSLPKFYRTPQDLSRDCENENLSAFVVCEDGRGW